MKPLFKRDPKILVCPDSFKGSLTAPTVATQIAQGIQKVIPSAQLFLTPLADGGEGTLTTLLTALGGDLRYHHVQDPLGRLIKAAYGLVRHPTTSKLVAIVELAQASGLTLIPSDLRDPTITSTYGTGELILAACQAGAEEIWIGLGGSGTNDGGTGLASALGIQFLDQAGCKLPPGGLALAQLATIDCTQKSLLLEGRTVRVICDVMNPLIGPMGASAIFGPQKGASPEQVQQLDLALTQLAHVIDQDLGLDIATRPGVGAAGGSGAGLVAFLGASLESGSKLILEAIGFDSLLDQADLVITGEGCLDDQSFMGKVVSGILEATTAACKPLLIVAGRVQLTSLDRLPPGVVALDLVSMVGSEEVAMREAAPLLEALTIQSLHRFNHVWFRELWASE